MKRLILLLTCFIISIGLSIAQTTRVSGTVVDENGEPVIGASVIVKENPAIGAVSNVDGQFTLDVPDSFKTLIIKYLGMLDQEVAIAPIITVKLKPSATNLDEVVVIAYGTAKKSSFTGSASQINSSTIERRQASNVTKTLQGASAGVSATSVSGQPGSSSTIRIRGVSSISANANPLYVIDGMPYEGNLNSINTMDIESITILKDAAANSMYGARGSNGVVLITTKKGKAGKSRVTFETRFGSNNKGISPYDIVRDPGQYLELEWEALRNRAISDGESNPNAWASKNLTGTSYGTGGYNPYGNVPGDQVIIDGKLNPNANLLYHDDWLKVPFKTGFRNEDVITVSGADEKTNYYISAGFLNDEAFIPNSDFQRFTGRAKLEQTVNTWFKTGINLSYTKWYMNSPWDSGSASAYRNLFMVAQQIAPIYPIYQYDQSTGAPLLDNKGNQLYDYGVTMGKRMYGANSNPISALKNDIRDTDNDITTAIGFAEFTFLKDFKFLTDISVENYNSFGNSFQTPIGGDALNVGGRNYRSSEKMFSLNSKQLLTWIKETGSHSIDALVGHETKNYTYNYLEASKENFLVPNNPELANAARLLDATSYRGTYSLESYFTRLNYGYDDKYYVTASYRYDGSSRFSSDNRWRGMWAAGLAWRINQESFLNNISEINNLKLKASYGLQGNDRVGRYNAYSDQSAIIPQDGEIGISLIYRGAPNLKWEVSKTFNAGVEFTLWDRVRGVAEYYDKKTEDLLYQKNLPPSMGSPSWIWDNAISLRNYGYEIELEGDIIKTNDFTWTVGGNITYLKNKILKLPEDRDPAGKGYRNGNYYYKVGNSLYDYYLYEYAGVDPATGSSLWWHDTKDESGKVTDSYVTSDYAAASYRENGKKALNDYYGGIMTTLQWKGLDLYVQGAYAIGGYAYDSQYANLMNNMDSPGNGIHQDVVNRRWTKPGDVTDVPKLQFGLQNQNATSTRFLTSRSYFSIQNITLGYTLPKKITNKLGIEKIRFYLAGDELFLNSSRQGYDPRLNVDGSTTYAYTAMRSTSIGFNINF
ncbi:SusC/RagA family TonB-linked outer membrane protein [Bacteroidia bacterium]|nr:SusC/RagA family TonB-linked outer membrane protein [Bacteroidia bacterium]GHT26924.1 SusC/RagA family TonB-linked outer membrane protein [Bacteroidia bacterium]GHV70699.1 SusC/RagA family TonB-linked outer membrane protein [Bacteroidia bacterium]